MNSSKIILKAFEKIYYSKRLQFIREDIQQELQERINETENLIQEQIVFARRRHEMNFSIGKFEIQLTPDHPITLNSRKFQYYNTFQGYLAENIDPNDCIIEIGSNIGDTFAVMANKNSKSKYFLIEANGKFFEYLKRNVERIRSKETVEVEIINAIIASSHLRVNMLVESNGTANIVESKLSDEQSLKCHELDGLIPFNLYSSIGLICIDTDGYDWNVIDSSLRIIESSKPMIYFEFDTANERISKYISTLKLLQKIGYVHYAVLDNFGNIVCKNCSLEILIELVDYARRSCSPDHTQTIYYYDVLIWTDERERLAVSALKKYYEVIN